MKRFVFLLSILFCSVAFAHTIEWYVGDTLLSTTTCESGDNITPPTAPAKFGYTFVRYDTYTPIEYLESTGTQYIDTGVIASSTAYRVETKFAKVSGSGSILGNQSGDTLFYIYYDTLTVYTNSTVRQTFSLIDTNPHTISLEYYNSNITIGGGYTGTFTTSWNPTRTIDLFANNYAGTHMDKGSIKLYFARFWNNDVLVRDFIPVLDKNGTPCMYDKVEGKYYYNAGTGDFIAGPVIVGE